ncbi:hypothetical protein PHYPSEUDO_015191 [Phytophthora pseudosyringae]|uniref:Crinkler (CRN) family protein n=1 Tax=Phytophthora pseudosyringae TaxID=221518 RepID=A0A8T1V438_9STRA|nr:hypothetical protein PHYPSEUDO_015191 [Phytophthora pseudosyringae]
MEDLLQNAFTFNIAFDESLKGDCVHSISVSIEMRVLWQLPDALDWKEFCLDRAKHVVAADAFMLLSRLTGKPREKLCVFLCVDGLEKLETESKTTRPEYQRGLGSLCSALCASSCWVTVVVSSTISRPFFKTLGSSSRRALPLQTEKLSRQTVQGDIFAEFGHEDLVRILIDDMGEPSKYCTK